MTINMIEIPSINTLANIDTNLDSTVDNNTQVDFTNIINECLLNTEEINTSENFNLEDIYEEDSNLDENINLIINTIPTTPSTNTSEHTSNLDINTTDTTTLTVDTPVKSIKSGMEFIDDVKYIQVNSEKQDSENNSPELVFEDTSDSFLNKIDTVVSKSNNNNTNDSSFTDNEVVEGDLIHFDNVENKETTLEEEIIKLTNDEIQSRDILEQLKNGINSSSTPRHIQIILKPRSLGTLNLNIKFINNAMHVDIHVDNEEIQKLLSNNLSQIEYLLDPENCLTIDTINIIKKQDDIRNDKNIIDRNVLLKEMMKNNQRNVKPIFLFK